VSISDGELDFLVAPFQKDRGKFVDLGWLWWLGWSSRAVVWLCDKGVVMPRPGSLKDSEANPFSASAEEVSPPGIESLYILHLER
jgi:hypothetical protein